MWLVSRVIESEVVLSGILDRFVYRYFCLGRLNLFETAGTILFKIGVVVDHHGGFLLVMWTGAWRVGEHGRVNRIDSAAFLLDMAPPLVSHRTHMIRPGRGGPLWSLHVVHVDHHHTARLRINYAGLLLL
jgi:hypothetical protein